MKGAAEYATHLLHSLGLETAPVISSLHPALAWARSGLMSLTGWPEGEPLMCPAPVAACADGALDALRIVSVPHRFVGLSGAALCAERAAIAGHSRAGGISPGGSCRLLRTADAGIALNLAREDDWALLPAWLESDVAADDWNAVTLVVKKIVTHDLVERGRELGLAVSPDVPVPSSTVPWFRVHHDSGLRRVNERAPRVLDLSSLWAGPLCSHLLQQLGADVVKVESTQRPDGARRGPPDFYDLLHAGQRSVALDFSSTEGREELRALIRRSDIVIEASRPRALRQLGIGAEQMLDETPGLTWVSLSGYGRGLPQEQWLGYGDDAAVGAGLSWLMHRATGQRVFAGDAIADPLTGLHAALAAWAMYRNGGGRLVSLALCDIVRHVLQFDLLRDADALRQRQREWSELAQSEVSSPVKRQPAGRAPDLGVHTDAVLREWSC